MKTEKIECITEFNEELEKEIYYIVDEQNNRFNLSEEIDYKINEVFEIVNNDLIFVNVDYYSGDELTGIYSFKQEELIFPFIITEFDTSDKSGYIYLGLNEDTSEYFNLDLNEANQFAYISQDGSVFQNEGIIEEKISYNYFILRDKWLDSFGGRNSYSYKLYSLNFDTDDHIGYSDIRYYQLSDDKKVLTIEIGSGDEEKTVKIDL